LPVGRTEPFISFHISGHGTRGGGVNFVILTLK